MRLHRAHNAKGQPSGRTIYVQRPQTEQDLGDELTVSVEVP